MTQKQDPVIATPAGEDGAIVDLRPTGTGRAFVRALARIIVRRELIFARVIPDPMACVTDAEAG